MSCSCTTTGGGTVVRGSGPIGVSGSGTASDPFIITEATGAGAAIEVRDSATVNMTLFGSGTKADPYVIRADTGSAASLQSLSDVSPSPAVAQGSVPLWIGSAAAGQFQFRTPGTRYTTSATRGTGLYLGEVIRETDTGTRYEWDGTQWVSLTPTPAAQFVLDSTVVVAAGSIGPSGPDLNTLVSRSGIYRVGNTGSNINMPAGAYNFGTLVVFVNGSSVTQRYSTHGVYEYVRTKWNDSDWAPWSRAATASEVDAVSTRVNSTSSYASQIDQRFSQDINDRTNRDNDLINDYRSRIDAVVNSGAGFVFTNGAQHGNTSVTRIVRTGRTVTLEVSLRCTQGFGTNGVGTLMTNISPAPLTNTDFVLRTSSNYMVWACVGPNGNLDWRAGGTSNQGVAQPNDELYGSITFIVA